MTFFDFRVMVESVSNPQSACSDGSFELNGAVGGGNAACVRVFSEDHHHRNRWHPLFFLPFLPLSELSENGVVR
jgi:hypothetical protein